MIALVGLLVVVGSVIGGFTIAGGKLLALFHISEIMVVAGTALGTVLVSTPGPTLMSLGRQLPRVVLPSPFTKVLYLDALKLLYELFQMAQRDGLVAIESHIESPSKSSLFKKYPRVLQHHEAVVFLSDSLRLVLLGTVSPHDLDTMMDNEIDVHHEQEGMKVKALQRAADALPGIGIVAAVLGIVVTMSAINGPIERIGEHVAAALTGTFLGVLLAYGFVNPVANGLENLQAAELRFFHFIKAAVVSVAKGSSPLVAVEFARRSIFADSRPSFGEMETACKSLKKPTAAAQEAMAKAA